MTRGEEPGSEGGRGEPFAEAPAGRPAVRGFLHRPVRPSGDGIVLVHGAGSSAEAPVLVSLAAAFAATGVTTLRCDLPYRQARPKGPPRPGDAARDREGLREALLALRRIAPGQAFLGGHSYGGRQASMLLAAEPGLADALLLLSYPLHPPRRPAERRIAHLPDLRAPTLFVHGSADPFGSIEELEAARALVPGRTALVAIDRAGHGLWAGRAQAASDRLARRVVAEFLALAAGRPAPAIEDPGGDNEDGGEA